MSLEILGTVKVEFCVYGFQLVAVLKIIKAARIYKVIVFGLCRLSVTLGIGKAFKAYSVIFGTFFQLINLVFIIGFRLFNAVFLQYLMRTNKTGEIAVFVCIVDSPLCLANTIVNILLGNLFALINKIGNDFRSLIPCKSFSTGGCFNVDTFGIIIRESNRSVTAVTANAELLL